VQIIQYIGYCSDEHKRIGKKLYSAYDVEYPLVNEGITTKQALEICKSYGFDFGNIYSHHQHFNCWCCPLQKRSELYIIYKDYPHLWDKLRKMQVMTDGYYDHGLSIFDFDKKFWLKQRKELKDKRMAARRKYNKRRLL